MAPWQQVKPSLWTLEHQSHHVGGGEPGLTKLPLAMMSLWEAPSVSTKRQVVAPLSSVARIPICKAVPLHSSRNSEVVHASMIFCL